MRLEPPEKVSEEQLTIDVREIEPLLQAPSNEFETLARSDDHS